MSGSRHKSEFKTALLNSEAQGNDSKRKDRHATEKEKQLRSKTPREAVYFSDLSESTFVKSLRIRGKSVNSSKVGDHVASFLAPKDRKKWNVIVNRFTSIYYVKENYNYRQAWGANAYNSVFVRLGAGYNDIDHRVSSFSAGIINALACNWGGHPRRQERVCWRECDCCYIGMKSCCWNAASVQDYIDNKAGIQFPDYVSVSNIESDCLSNFARSLCCLPCNTIGSALECLCADLPSAIGNASKNYSVYDSAPTCCNTNRDIPLGVGARYRGCSDRLYYNTDGAIDHLRFSQGQSCCVATYTACCYNSQFIANTLCTDLAGMTGIPFLNVCCATAYCTLCYAVGTGADCLTPNKYRYVQPGKNTIDTSIAVNDCILLSLTQAPSDKFLRQLGSNAGYYVFNNAIYYYNFARNVKNQLNLKPYVVRAFNSRLAPLSNSPIVLSHHQLDLIRIITGHSHIYANESDVHRALAKDATNYAEPRESERRFARQKAAYAAIKNDKTMTRGDDTKGTRSLISAVRFSVFQSPQSPEEQKIQSSLRTLMLELKNRVASKNQKEAQVDQKHPVNDSTMLEDELCKLFEKTIQTFVVDGAIKKNADAIFDALTQALTKVNDKIRKVKYSSENSNLNYMNYKTRIMDLRSDVEAYRKIPDKASTISIELSSKSNWAQG